MITKRQKHLKNITGILTRSLILIGLLLSIDSCKQSQRELVWSDEFDYTGLPDPAKWGYEEGFVRNKEPQYYTVGRKENARVENGCLVIEARKEQFIKGKDTAAYTSASVITMNKAEFKYGHIEFKAKFDAKQGMWPAFWMLGVNRGPVKWPACGEVDFLEYYRGDLHANSVHQGEDGQQVWNGKATKVEDLGGPDWDKEFHIYTVDWDEKHIAIYVDDVLLNDIPITETINHPMGNNPFHEKFYFLINLALGHSGEIVPDENLSSKYYVDYIRVYQ